MQEPYFLQTRPLGLFLLPFNVNRIHKHIKNPQTAQENTRRRMYRYLQALANQEETQCLW